MLPQDPSGSNRASPSSSVRLLDGPLRDRQSVNARHLKNISADCLLAVFRRDAGLPKKAESYGGWEARGIGGHIMGHYLSALAWHFAETKESWAADRARAMVDELAACQQAHGDGGIMPVAREALLALKDGQIDANNAKLNGFWVPFYMLHKVFAGLRDAYRLIGYDRALEVESELAKWVDDILCGLSPEQIQTMLTTEHGGMNEAFADLAADTGDVRYLRMAADYFHHAKVLNPILAGEDQLDGLHGNTQIPKVVGLAREYELGGNTVYQKAAESFWRHVVEDRSFATGGHGESEHFFPPKEFPQRLTPYTCETCNSYNMLKLTSHLFAWSPEEKRARQMDFVERTLINHLAANIGHEPGEYGYFLGLESVAVKVFSTPYDSWWCCVGTGLENPTRYAEQIYFEDEDAVWVNLYAGSELKSASGGFTLRQETRFPEEDQVRISISCDAPVDFKLKFRHPEWCAKLELTLNGEPWECDSQPSSYVVINRGWSDGDRLGIRLPMKLQVEPLPHSDRKQLAVMFGPILLAAIVPPDPDQVDPAKDRFEDHLYARGKTDEFPPLFVTASEEKLLAGLTPTEVFGEFRSQGVIAPDDLRLMPLHKIYEEHYAVYLPRLTPQEWREREIELRAAQARQTELAAATLDRMQPGQQQPEIDHEFEGQETETRLMHHCHGRIVKSGGWCSYRLQCATDETVAVVLTFWGGDWLSPTFDILVDGERIATQSLSNKRISNFYEVAYPVPSDLTRGKSSIVVRIEPKPGSEQMSFYGTKLMHSELVMNDPHFSLPKLKA